jgi:hypothetical protein
MNTRPLITEAERQAYGDEALSVMERKAREVVGPAVQRLNEQNQQLRNELQRVKANDIYATLDQNLPDWREINQMREWRSWLAVPDIYSGVSRQRLLDAAFAAGDSNRVLLFLRGFLSENARSAPAVHASRSSADNSRPTITNKDVERFYENVRRGYYTGNDQQKAVDEAKIHAAVREGRVQRV